MTRPQPEPPSSASRIHVDLMPHANANRAGTLDPILPYLAGRAYSSEVQRRWGCSTGPLRTDASRQGRNPISLALCCPFAGEGCGSSPVGSTASQHSCARPRVRCRVFASGHRADVQCSPSWRSRRCVSSSPQALLMRPSVNWKKYTSGTRWKRRPVGG